MLRPPRRSAPEPYRVFRPRTTPLTTVQQQSLALHTIAVQSEAKSVIKHFVFDD
jgi:hypothetical protein